MIKSGNNFSSVLSFSIIAICTGACQSKVSHPAPILTRKKHRILSVTGQSLCFHISPYSFYLMMWVSKINFTAHWCNQIAPLLSNSRNPNMSHNKTAVYPSVSRWLCTAVVLLLHNLSYFKRNLSFRQGVSFFFTFSILLFLLLFLFPTWFTASQWSAHVPLPE